MLQHIEVALVICTHGCRKPITTALFYSPDLTVLKLVFFEQENIPIFEEPFTQIS